MTRSRNPLFNLSYLAEMPKGWLGDRKKTYTLAGRRAKKKLISPCKQVGFSLTHLLLSVHSSFSRCRSWLGCNCHWISLSLLKSTSDQPMRRLITNVAWDTDVWRLVQFEAEDVKWLVTLPDETVHIVPGSCPMVVRVAVTGRLVPEVRVEHALTHPP